MCNFWKFSDFDNFVLEKCTKPIGQWFFINIGWKSRDLGPSQHLAQYSPELLAITTILFDLVLIVLSLILVQ